MLQGSAFQKFHREERMAVGFVNIINGADVGMVERGSRARASRLNRSSPAVARELVGQKLQRDESAKLDVFGLIHHAHSAAADFFQNAIVGRSFRQSLRVSGPPDSLSPSRCMWRTVARRW